MTNPYYTETFQASIGSLSRSAALEAQFTLIEQAFDLLIAQVVELQGITNITNLSGFPASFVDHAGQFLVVNSAENSVEFVSAGKITNKVIGGTSYTILASDAGKRLIFTNASAVTLTVPPDTLVSGEVVLIVQGAAGQVTLVAGSGVTFASSDNLLATRTQSAQIGIIANGGEAFGVYGERNAPTLGVALLAQANVFTKAQTVTPVALTDAATIATDASLSNTFTVVLGGNRTLGNPTNLTNGCIYNWYFTQDGTGSRTMAYGSKFKFPGDTAPVLTTTASKTDLITGQYFSGPDVIRMGTLIKGYGA